MRLSAAVQHSGLCFALYDPPPPFGPCGKSGDPLANRFGLREYKEQLLERDRIVQEDAIGGQNECFIIAHNSLVRVLDKVFWIDGA